MGSEAKFKLNSEGVRGCRPLRVTDPRSAAAPVVSPNSDVKERSVPTVALWQGFLGVPSRRVHLVQHLLKFFLMVVGRFGFWRADWFQGRNLSVPDWR